MLIPFALPAVGPALSVAGAIARTWWKAGLGAGLGALLCFPLAHCDGVHDERAAAKARAAAAREVQAARVAAADQAAAVRRVEDATTLQAKSKERTDAIHAGPDAPVSGPECRLNRKRLQQRGVAEASLPACR